MKTFMRSLCSTMLAAVMAHGTSAAPPGDANCTADPDYAAGIIVRWPTGTVCAGSTVTFHAQIPIDNDTCDDTRTLKPDTVSVAWDFGDGTGGSGTPVVHQFANTTGIDKTYTVTATFTDGRIWADDFQNLQSPTATLSVTVSPTSYTATLSGNLGPTRGSSATYTVTTTPNMSNPTYEWTFTGGDGVTKTGPNAASWGGTMVKSGTISVTVRGACAASSGSLGIGVVARTWTDTRPDQSSDGGNGGFPVAPMEYADLGRTESSGAHNGDYTRVATGPNTDYNYVSALPILWSSVAFVNSSINEYSTFVSYQCPPTYLSVPDLLQKVRVHEGIDTYPGFTSHWGKCRDWLDDHPIRSAFEGAVSHATTENLSAFMTRVSAAIGVACQRVLSEGSLCPVSLFEDIPTNFHQWPPCP